MLSFFVRFILFRYCVVLTCILFHALMSAVDNVQIHTVHNAPEKMQSQHKHVEKVVLDNGLTVLVCESHEIPQVFCQIWYNVGSKDEMIGEKGIAHLIEHMIFK